MPRKKGFPKRRVTVDPSLLPMDIEPPAPPNLKLQVRGNQDSGYRVCTYLAHWRGGVVNGPKAKRARGTCYATNVKTVGYIEKHRRSGKIIFIPEYYLEVPELRYYDVFRDFDHCTYQLRADWRETWYLTSIGKYVPPEESMNLNQELARLRKLVLAKKRAAEQGIELEIDFDAPPPPTKEQLEAQRRAANQARWQQQNPNWTPNLMGVIPTTDALKTGKYKLPEVPADAQAEVTEPSFRVPRAHSVSIVPAVARAGTRAPMSTRSELPRPEDYLSLFDDPNCEWNQIARAEPQETEPVPSSLSVVARPKKRKRAAPKFRTQALPGTTVQPNISGSLGGSSAPTTLSASPSASPSSSTAPLTPPEPQLQPSSQRAAEPQSGEKEAPPAGARSQLKPSAAKFRPQTQAGLTGSLGPGAVGTGTLARGALDQGSVGLGLNLHESNLKRVSSDDTAFNAEVAVAAAPSLAEMAAPSGASLELTPVNGAAAPTSPEPLGAPVAGAAASQQAAAPQQVAVPQQAATSQQAAVPQQATASQAEPTVAPQIVPVSGAAASAAVGASADSADSAGATRRAAAPSGSGAHKRWAKSKSWSPARAEGSGPSKFRPTSMLQRTTTITVGKLQLGGRSEGMASDGEEE